MMVAGAASAAVTLTGDPTTSTGLAWNTVGNSLQSSGVIWASGSTTRDMSYYTSSFRYSSSDSSTASMGNGATVGGTGWNEGDRVVAIGWKVNNGNVAGWLNGETWIKLNPGGTGGYSAANAVGGTGASTSFSNSVTGDYQLYGSVNFGNESRVTQFRYRTAGGSSYPMQSGGTSAGALLADPFRSYSVLAAGTVNAGEAEISSQIYLINVDFLSRAGTSYGFSANMIGDTIGKMQVLVNQGAGRTATEVVMSNVAVPAPGAAALVGLAGLVGGRRRRA